MEAENGKNLAKNIGAEKSLELDCEVSQLFSMRAQGVHRALLVPPEEPGPRECKASHQLCSVEAVSRLVTWESHSALFQAVSFWILFGGAFHCSLKLSSGRGAEQNQTAQPHNQYFKVQNILRFSHSASFLQKKIQKQKVPLRMLIRIFFSHYSRLKVMSPHNTVAEK